MNTLSISCSRISNAEGCHLSPCTCLLRDISQLHGVWPRTPLSTGLSLGSITSRRKRHGKSPVESEGRGSGEWRKDGRGECTKQRCKPLDRTNLPAGVKCGWQVCIKKDGRKRKADGREGRCLGTKVASPGRCAESQCSGMSRGC